MTVRSEPYTQGPDHSRETHGRLGPDEFEEIFELADPGKDFQGDSRTRFKRVR